MQPVPPYVVARLDQIDAAIAEKWPELDADERAELLMNSLEAVGCAPVDAS